MFGNYTKGSVVGPIDVVIYSCEELRKGEM
jgi:hypothetical protein